MQHSEVCPPFVFSKPRGLRAGRKLATHRKAQRWADKDFKKTNLGNEIKKPFGGCSHAKGIVLEKMCVLSLRYWCEVLRAEVGCLQRH